MFYRCPRRPCSSSTYAMNAKYLASVAAIRLFQHSCLFNQMDTKQFFVCVWSTISPSNNNLNVACYWLLLSRVKIVKCCEKGKKNVDHLLVKKHRDTIPNELNPTLLLIVITLHAFGSNMGFVVCCITREMIYHCGASLSEQHIDGLMSWHKPK